MDQITAIPHLIILIPPEGIRDIASMADFFRVLGLNQLFESRDVTDVSQMWMNKAACEGLEDIVFQNARKDKRYKYLTDHALKTAVAMDWLNYSPVSVDYIPENELWVFTLENAKKALDAYRAYIREKERKECD